MINYILILLGLMASISLITVAGTSILFNAFLFWYCIRLIERLYLMSDNVSALLLEVVHYGDHLSSVHELEMFYGDEVLGNLIKHSKTLLESFKEFEGTHLLFEAEQDEYTEEVLDDASA
jgi:hypothetical protein